MSLSVLRKMITSAALAAGLLISGSMSVSAKIGFGSKSKAQTEPENDIFELSIAENVATPAIPKKSADAVLDKLKREAKRLKTAGIAVELARGGEVLVATIGADKLFMPNSTELRQSAGNFLRPFTTLLTQPSMWKILVVMHSDDTGSEEYVNNLTETRAEAVCAWFEALSLDTSAMVPYGCGADEPLTANNSRLNRGANRRLELYLIPDKTMIDMAKRGLIP